MQEAAALGATRGEAFRSVVVPMLRPAIAAGAAIVAMETLTDFATVQYFGVDTVTVGVFRIWRGSYDRDAAAEIASLVLVFAFFAIVLERMFRGVSFRPLGPGTPGSLEELAARIARGRERGYAIADATVRYVADKNWTFELVASNLFDKRYEHAVGYDAPRRGVFLNVRFETF